MTTLRSAFISALLAGSSLMPATALAQTGAAVEPPAAETDAGGLDDVVVTARRREENLQDVPIAVTAFTSETILTKGIVDRTSLADNTPSLFTINGGYPREFAFFALRGQGPAFGSTPGVVNYFAEVPNSINIDGRVGSYYDLASVQVLAGPQGTLFGKNATGGNILFEPMKPQDRFEGYVRAQVGNYKDRRLEGAINVPLVSDTVLLRVAGEIGRRDGYTIDVGPNFAGKDYDNLSYQSFRVGLTLRPVDGVESYTVFRLYDADNNGGGTVLGYVNPVLAGVIAGFAPNLPSLTTQFAQQQARGPRRVAYDLNQFAETKYWQVVNQTSIDLSDSLTLRNIISYSEFRNKYGYDYDASILPLIGQSSRAIPTLAPNYFTEELQLQGNLFDGGINFAIGGYLDRQSWNDPAGIENYTQFPTGALTPTIPFYQTLRNSSEAVFGQLTADLGKFTPALTGLSLTAGLRYTWEYSFTSTTLIAPPAVTGTAESDYPSYTVTLDYEATDGVHAYITARNAYKSGGVNGPVPVGSPFRTFPPEKLSDIELGLKSQFEVGQVKVRANLAAYRGIYDNIQRTTQETISGVSLNVTRSAAKGRIQGIEFNGVIQPVEGLTLNGSYSYIDGKYTRVNDASANAILAGAPFPYTPKHKFSIGGSYEAELGGAGTFAVSANYVHQSSVSTAQTNGSFLNYLPGYGMLNASADLRDVGGMPLDLGLFVTNLTKTTTPVGVLDFYNVLGTVGLTYTEPRMYGLRATYRFGR